MAVQGACGDGKKAGDNPLDRWVILLNVGLEGRKQVRATGRNSARNKTKTSGYLRGELRSRSVTKMNTLSL